jgi:type I restriction enzyme, S subunit
VDKLPQGWGRFAIQELIELNPKNTDISDNTNVGFIPMPLLGKDFKDTPSFENRIWSDVKKGYTHFQDGDVLLAKITPCFENGKAGIAKSLPNGIGAGSTEYFVCRANHEILLSEYLLAYFKTQEFVRLGELGMTGSVGHKRVAKDYLLESEIPLPPLNEQRRIADRLDHLLTRIDKTKAHLDRIPPLLKRFRQSVLAAATSGKLTEDWREANGVDITTSINGTISPDGDFLAVLQSMDYEIPDVWTWTTPDLMKADEKHSLSIGPFGSNLVVKDYRDSGVPLVFVREIRAQMFGDKKTKYINREKAEELWAHRVEPGDLLITKMGDPPGDVAIFPETRPISIITSDCIRLKVNPEIASKNLLALFVESALVRTLIQTITAGVAQQKISLQRFRVMPFPLPPLPEQHEIVRRVETLFAKADRIEAQYKKARQEVDRLTPALLAKAFRGELVPQDPEDEPAIVLLERIRGEKKGREKREKGRSKKQTPT